MFTPPSSGSQAPRGILKKPKSPAVPTSLLSESAPRPIEQQIAIQQAHRLLQQRGEDIKPPVPLEVYERLIELPRVRGPDLTAANPSSQDVHEFIEAVEDFLPREYLDLIEERNCMGNCGYTLCPKPRRQYAGPYKLLRTGIASTADVNMWCSQKCARRALYIKVQLDNPSYVYRDGETKVRVELLEESVFLQQEQHAAKSTPQSGVDKTKAAVDANALAVERGDAARPLRTMEVTIREKPTSAPAQAPVGDASGNGDSHLAVEGHKTAFGTANEDEDMDSDDEYLPSTIRM